MKIDLTKTEVFEVTISITVNAKNPLETTLVNAYLDNVSVDVIGHEGKYAIVSSTVHASGIHVMNTFELKRIPEQ